MVVCTLHLISLKPSSSAPAFLAALRAHGLEPVFQAAAVRWMVLPTELSAAHLLGRNVRWDLLVGLGGQQETSQSQATPADVASRHTAAVWSAACGASGKALAGYGAANAELLRNGPATAPRLPLQGRKRGGDDDDEGNNAPSSSQNLELSHELAEWIGRDLPTELRGRPVSMLNLLAFNPGRNDDYKKYGQAFSTDVGKRYGGKVKIVGRVIDGQGEAQGQRAAAKAQGWDEVAFVHYPSLDHFAGMLASDEYQAANHKYRLGALKDTFIMCVVEIDDQGRLVGRQIGGQPGKL